MNNQRENIIRCPAPSRAQGTRLIGLLLLLLSAVAPDLQGAQAKVTLRNGQIQVVDVISADQNGIMWRGGRVVAPTLLKHDQIAFIDFQEPRGWEDALQSFHQQEFDKAITYFAGIAGNRTGHYYPAPGNYSSQAMLHLVNCYIETGNYAEISKVAPGINAASLPIEYRYRAPIIAAWAELGKGAFDKASLMVDSIENKAASAGKAELAFIKGFALEKAGKTEAAIQAYGGVYSLDFGADTAISRKALESSIRLLESLNDKNRAAELQALVHIYAHSFGEGDLYPNASSLAHEMLTKELGLENIGDSVNDRPDTAKSQSKATIITLDFAEKSILRAGKETPLMYSNPVYTRQQINDGKKGNFTKVQLGPGVSLRISGVGSAPSQGKRRLVAEPNKGLSVMRVGENDHEGEGIRLAVEGDIPGFRIASLTFGAGDVTHTWGSGDQASIEVEQLKPGQPQYQTSLSAEGEDEEFTTIELSGGFIANFGGKGELKLTQAKGRFSVASLSIELETSTSASK